MNLEYLIVGIAKDQQEDYKEFYEKTKIEVYMYALSIVKDRFLAREIAIEAYRRVKMLAYKFDTDLNAEYWLLDIVKNLSLNSLKRDEFKKTAEGLRVDNLSGLLRAAIVETAEDRGQIIVLRIASTLSKSDIARLLWYQKGSATSEFGRGIKELVKMSPDDRTKASVITDLKEDMKKCTPDMWGLLVSDEETKVSFISHEEIDISNDELAFSNENEELQKVKRAALTKTRKKKIYTAIAASIIGVCIIAATIIGIVVYNKSKTPTQNNNSSSGGDILPTLPQYGTKLAMIEVNGVLYFQDHSNGGVLSKATISNGKADIKKLSNDEVKEIITDGTSVYYRNNKDGKIYKMSLNDDKATKLSSMSGTCITYYDGHIYFSCKTGINRIDIDGNEESMEEVFVIDNINKPNRYNIEIADDGTLYFSGGAKTGLYCLSEFEGANVNQDIYGGNVYDFTVFENDIYFDSSEYNTTVLCSIDTENKNTVKSWENVFLASAAICVKDGYIYYEGYSSVEKEGAKHGRGIYRVSTEGGEPSLVVSTADSNMYVSDMYISDSKMYCYFNTGKENGKIKLVCYELNGLTPENASSKNTVIFETKS